MQFWPILNFGGVFKSSLSSKRFLPVVNHPVFDYTSPFSAVISTFLLVTPILGCTFRLLRWRTVWSAREPSRPSRMVRISCQTSTSWSANLALVACFFFPEHQSVSYSVNAGFINTSSFLRHGVPFPPSHSNSIWPTFRGYPSPLEFYRTRLLIRGWHLSLTIQEFVFALGSSDLADVLMHLGEHETNMVMKAKFIHVLQPISLHVYTKPLDVWAGFISTTLQILETIRKASTEILAKGMSSHPRIGSLGSLQRNLEIQPVTGGVESGLRRQKGSLERFSTRWLQAGHRGWVHWKELDFASKASICWPPFLDKNGFHRRFPEIFREFSMVFLGFLWVSPVSSTIFSPRFRRHGACACGFRQDWERVEAERRRVKAAEMEERAKLKELGQPSGPWPLWPWWWWDGFTAMVREEKWRWIFFQHFEWVNQRSKWPMGPRWWDGLLVAMVYRSFIMVTIWSLVYSCYTIADHEHSYQIMRIINILMVDVDMLTYVDMFTKKFYGYIYNY